MHVLLEENGLEEKGRSKSGEGRGGKSKNLCSEDLIVGGEGVKEVTY